MVSSLQYLGLSVVLAVAIVLYMLITHFERERTLKLFVCKLVLLGIGVIVCAIMSDWLFLIVWSGLAFLEILSFSFPKKNKSN